MVWKSKKGNMRRNRGMVSNKKRHKTGEVVGFEKFNVLPKGALIPENKFTVKESNLI